MSFDSLDNFLINLSFQVNSEILLKKRKEVNDLNKGKLSRNFLHTTIICQILLLITGTSDRHTKMRTSKNIRKTTHGKIFNALGKRSCRAGHKISGALV